MILLVGLTQVSQAKTLQHRNGSTKWKGRGEGKHTTHCVNKAYAKDIGIGANQN